MIAPGHNAARVVVVGTVIPNERGSLAQRDAAAVRRALRRFGSLKWLVLDLDGTEIASRGVLETDTILIPVRPPRSSLPSISSRHFSAPDFQALAELSEAGVQKWLGPARFRRLVARLTTLAPGVVIIDDARVVGLVESLVIAAPSTVIWLRGTGAVHEYLSQEARSEEWRCFHELNSSVFARALKLSQLSCTATWAEVDTPRSLITAANVSVVPRPTLGVFDPRLVHKEPIVVIPSAGIGWVNDYILRVLSGPLNNLRMLSAQLQVVLVGFGVSAADVSADVDNDWGNLETWAGRARCVFLPLIGPDSGEMVRMSLAMGTPVVCSRSAAKALNIDFLPGVFSYDKNQSLVEILQLVLLTDHCSPDFVEGLASAAATRFGPEICSNFLQQALSSLHADVVRELLPSGSAMRRSYRISPLDRPPILMFNEATRLLLVEVQLRKRLGVSEVHIKAADDVVIGRLVVPIDPSSRPVQVFQAGVILDENIPLTGLSIEVYDAAMLLDSAVVVPEHILRVEGEISALHVTDASFDGAFWIKGDVADVNGWVLRHDGHDTMVAGTGSVLLRSLGITAVPFRMMRARKVGVGDQISIGRLVGAERIVAAAAQRPLNVNRQMLVRDPVPPELKRLYGIHKGQRAWMIGNGPSVRHADLDAIPAGDVKFAFNRFYKCYGSTSLREDYVVSADTLMIEDFGQEIVDLANGMPIFCHTGIENVVGRYVFVNPMDNYLPVFSYDLEHFASVGGSSVFVALQLAFYMGIREVLLYGMDFTFTANAVRDPRYRFPVCFDDDNHFIKGYRASRPWCPPNWRDISTAFLNARVAFELKGGKILNATRGGRLEIFDRVDFAEAVAAARPIDCTVKRQGTGTPNRHPIGIPFGVGSGLLSNGTEPGPRIGIQSGPLYSVGSGLSR